MSGNNNSKKNHSKNKNYAKNNGNNKRKNDDIDLLERTNSFDIIIDEDRLKDKESLDVSFVDGKRKKKKAVKQAIEVLEEDIDYKEEAKKIDIPPKRKSDVFSTCLIILFSFTLGVLICYLWARESNHFKKVEIVKETITETSIVVDENILFLGDSIFEGYDLEKYYDGIHVVNSGISGNTTSDILKDMNNRIYKYNPSKVILLIGTNDINKGVEIEKVVENIEKIVDGIKENRPYADIYIQSVYPVNRSDDDKIELESVGKRKNSVISDMNEKIKRMCSEKSVTYMNIYDSLLNEDGELELDYTLEGLHITEKGYSVITSEVMKYLDNN